ncbi:MAG: c-type cytochrome biogenesis protein CcmI [Zoogloeaceae bacterium]|jgi:cytochrome c-type biogenesis protein CcmH|nr:c-type cytochrome biogenesis protein CcmI [Zoogloeaceae bacterium]
MTTFLALALLLFALAAAVLLWPLLRLQRTAEATAQTETTLAILKEQLRELEREFQSGQSDAATFAEARAELERRILEEAGDDPATFTASPTSSAPGAASLPPARKSAVFFLVFGLSCALAGYAWLGKPAALDLAARQLSPEQQLESMLARLAAYLEANPGDAQGWLTLGRAYAGKDRAAEAAQAFSHAEEQIASDAALLVEYAEILVLANGTLTGKATQLLDAALKLDPERPRALFLAGAAAYEAGNRQAALAHWEKLYPRMQPGSEAHAFLTAKLEELRAAEDKEGKTTDKKQKAESKGQKNRK